MQFDQLLAGYLGDFGPYQRRVYFLVCLPAIFCAVNMFCWTFTGADVPHRCKIHPGDDDWATPPNNSFFHFAGDRSKLSSCFRFRNFSIMDDRYGEVEPCLDGYVWDNSEIPPSALQEWELVCDREWIKATVQSMYYIGMFFGSITAGYLSDRFGRKFVLLTATFFITLISALSVFSPNVWVFMGFRFAQGFLEPAVWQIAFVIGIELAGPSKRLIAGQLIEYFFSLGLIFLGGLAYFVRDWKALQIGVSLPGFLFMSYYWLLPESPRWLLAVGRKEEAKRILRRAAVIGKVELPDEALELVDETSVDIGIKQEPEAHRQHTSVDIGIKQEPEAHRQHTSVDIGIKQEPEAHRQHTSVDIGIKQEPEAHRQHTSVDIGIKQEPEAHRQHTSVDIGIKQEPEAHRQHTSVDIGIKQEPEAHRQHTYSHLVRTPNLRRKTLIMCYCWCIVTLVYYGISLNPSALAGDFYISFIMSGVTELVAISILFLTLNRLGRRAIQTAGFLLSGLALILILCVPHEGYEWVVLSLVMLAKLSVVACFCTIYLYTSEIFPTVVRSIAIGLTSTCARIGGVAAPFASLFLDNKNRTGLLVAFGTCSVLAALLTLMLPETTFRTLPETLEDAENFGNELFTCSTTTADENSSPKKKQVLGKQPVEA